MRQGRRSTALLLALAALCLAALGAVGCGDDEGNEVTLPTISVEEETTGSAPQTDTATTEPAPGDGGTGGTGPVNPDEPDSPTNDKPPPPGSPEEAFENACEQNPAACG